MTLTATLVLETGEDDLFSMAVAVVTLAEGHGEGVVVAAPERPASEAAVEAAEAGHLEFLAELG